MVMHRVCAILMTTVAVLATGLYGQSTTDDLARLALIPAMGLSTEGVIFSVEIEKLAQLRKHANFAAAIVGTNTQSIEIGRRFMVGGASQKIAPHAAATLGIANSENDRLGPVLGLRVGGDMAAGEAVAIRLEARGIYPNYAGSVTLGIRAQPR